MERKEKRSEGVATFVKRQAAAQPDADEQERLVNDLTVVERTVDLEEEETRNSGAESTAMVLNRANTGGKENAAHVACVEEEQDGVECGL